MAKLALCSLFLHNPHPARMNLVECVPVRVLTSGFTKLSWTLGSICGVAVTITPLYHFPQCARQHTDDAAVWALAHCFGWFCLQCVFIMLEGRSFFNLASSCTSVLFCFVLIIISTQKQSRSPDLFSNNQNYILVILRFKNMIHTHIMYWLIYFQSLGKLVLPHRGYQEFMSVLFA